MATVLASKIIGEVRTKLNDVGTVKRWSDSDLLVDLNFIQRFITKNKGNSNVITATMSMVSGTRQTIPADGIYFVAVDNNTGGSVVSFAEKAEFDAIDRAWHSAAQVVSVENYCTAGKEDEKSFFVYPPSDGTGSLEIRYQALPAEVAAIGNGITIANNYENDIKNGILWQAFSIDTEYSDNNKAQFYYGLLKASIGMQKQVDQSLSPSLNAPPIKT